MMWKQNTVMIVRVYLCKMAQCKVGWKMAAHAQDPELLVSLKELNHEAAAGFVSGETSLL